MYPSVSISSDTTSVLVSIYHLRYNLCIGQYLSFEIKPLYLSVSITRDTSYIFVSIYHSRYKLCIRQYISLEIQAIYLSVSITRDTTLVCFNSDTTLSVFLSLYLLIDTNHSLLLYTRINMCLKVMKQTMSD